MATRARTRALARGFALKLEGAPPAWRPTPSSRFHGALSRRILCTAPGEHTRGGTLRGLVTVPWMRPPLVRCAVPRGGGLKSVLEISLRGQGVLRLAQRETPRA